MITKGIQNNLISLFDYTYRPITIYLFGSYAWGKPDKESDLDLLVVVEKSDLKPQSRSEIGAEALWNLKIPKDLLIYTKDEFAQRVNDFSTLCHKVKRDGKVLYARA